MYCQTGRRAYAAANLTRRLQRGRAVRKLGPTAIALSLAAGCATSSMSPTVTLPDGSQGHRVDCSRSSGNWDKCYEKAQELCGLPGFYVVKEYEDISPHVASGQGASPLVTRTLYFRCWRYPFPSSPAVTDS